MNFSIIIPVYNRPNEIQELLESLVQLDYGQPFEIVIIEDGSTIGCEDIINNFRPILNISYFYKENSGPGASRNFGMQRAKGDYFLIFDSDCVIPTEYLSIVTKKLSAKYYHCFGGPDDATEAFSNIQKAINYSMTSFLTTGGIRGGAKNLKHFEPRSFNMGLSKRAFELSGGFGNIHPGEDPDLSMRLWNLGIETTLFSDAFVYHKRRISWKKFYIQVNKFGTVRPILNKLHRRYAKVTYFFPALFTIGFVAALLLWLFKMPLLIIIYLFYFICAGIQAALIYKNITVGFMSALAVAIQFFGYGIGFIYSYFNINLLNRKPEMVFPQLFFKNK